MSKRESCIWSVIILHTTGQRTLTPTEFRKTGSFARDFSRGVSTLVRNFIRKAVLLLETSTGRQQGGAAFAKVFNRDIVLLLRTSLTGGFALVRNFNREVMFLLRTSAEKLWSCYGLQQPEKFSRVTQLITTAGVQQVKLKVTTTFWLLIKELKLLSVIEASFCVLTIWHRVLVNLFTQPLSGQRRWKGMGVRFPLFQGQ